MSRPNESDALAMLAALRETARARTAEARSYIWPLSLLAICAIAFVASGVMGMYALVVGVGHA